jgi:glucose-1-phosphate cytidylyltransferase
MSDLVIDFANNRVQPIARTVEPWRVALIDTGTESMTGGRLKRLAAHLDGGAFMMTYGDGLADVDLNRLLTFHRKHGRLATFTAVHPPSLFGKPQLEGDRVVRFTEKPSDADQWINGGFFVFEPDVMSFIEDDETSLEMQTLPALAKAEELMAFRHEGFWHPMDTLRDVRNLNRLWDHDEVPWRVWDSPTPTGSQVWAEPKPQERDAAPLLTSTAGQKSSSARKSST